VTDHVSDTGVSAGTGGGASLGCKGVGGEVAEGLGEAVRGSVQVYDGR
jgi:hypothetical protein